MRTLTVFALAPVPAVVLYVGVPFLYASIAWVGLPPLYYLLAQLSFFVVVGLIISYSIIGLIAFPKYLLLRSRNIESALVTIVIASLLGSLITFVPEVFRAVAFSEVSSSSRIGTCRDIIDNVRTACGYILLFKEAAFPALCGAIAGATFWLIYRNEG